MRFIKTFVQLFLFTALITSTLTAQVDRTQPPEGDAAPEINLKEPETFTLKNGLEVIVSENHELPKVSYQLTVDVDPVKEGEAKGYVDAAGSLLRNGTENRSKAEIDEAVDFIGASLNTYKNGIYASSLTKHQDKLLKIVSDVLMAPTFPKEEVKKYKQREISGLNASKTNPSAIARRVSQKIRFEGHPYGEITTTETIKNITREKIADYYNSYYKPNTSYLVIVGDITPEKAKQKAKKYFGDWEKGDVPTHEYDFPERNTQKQVAMANVDDAEQSVISITYPVKLHPGDEDAIPARIANSILGGGVFSGYLMQNLREDKGYTYGARSRLNKDELVGFFKAGAEVNTAVTDSAVTQFLKEMNRVRDEKVSKEHLDLVKNVITGKFARSLENPRTYANFALNIQKYDLPDDYYSTYLKKVDKVGANEVQSVARDYILPDKSTIVVVGSKEDVHEKLKRFDSDGNIDMYDAFGNPVETSEAEADMNAEKVIERYIEVRGGRKNFNKINDMVQIASADKGGRKITVKTFQKKPDLMATHTIVGGNVFQKQLFDGENGKIVRRGQESELSGEQLNNLKFEAKMHKFLQYDDLNVKTELKGIEETKGEKAYKIQLEYPNGKTRTDYFSKESGLRIKSKSTQSTPQGDVTVVREFSNYKEIDGVLFPFEIAISGQQNLTLNVDSIEINSGLKKAKFQ